MIIKVHSMRSEQRGFATKRQKKTAHCAMKQNNVKKLNDSHILHTAGKSVAERLRREYHALLDRAGVWLDPRQLRHTKLKWWPSPDKLFLFFREFALFFRTLNPKVGPKP
jgi:hypothetical protein